MLCLTCFYSCRNFDLKLKKDNSVFSHDHMLKESDGTLRSIDTSYIYTGHLEGGIFNIVDFGQLCLYYGYDFMLEIYHLGRLLIQRMTR